MNDNSNPAAWNPLEAPPGLRHDVVRRTDTEIAEVMDWAADLHEGDNGMPRTADPAKLEYARGVSDSIAWLLGQSEDNPKEGV